MIYQIILDRHERKIITDILSQEDFKLINNKKTKEIGNIIFVVPELLPFAGGHTSILRLGTKLEEKGYSVIYASISKQKAATMRSIAVKNLSSVRGKFLTFSSLELVSSENNIIVATSWQTAYYAKRLRGYKLYFVQDFEPYFFKLNERYLLAKKTYEMGFHIISLGAWNIKQITRECNVSKSHLDSIDFPYEGAEYSVKHRDYHKYSLKKEFQIAVYAKEEGKRLPNLLQNILERTSQILNKEGITLKILFFGFNKHYPVSVGQNLGKLTKKELEKLYQESDFGLVASMTNISLVPYEMLATGLPIIEFVDGSFPFFFPEGSATLIDFNAELLAKEVLNNIKEPSILEKQIQRARHYLKTLSWDKSAQQFEEILKEVCYDSSKD